MKALRVIGLAGALTASLSACGRPDLIGNERGGIIDWHATNEREVFQMAEEHCAKFKKGAKITNLDARAGGKVIFACEI